MAATTPPHDLSKPDPKAIALGISGNAEAVAVVEELVFFAGGQGEREETLRQPHLFDEPTDGDP